MMPVQIHKYTPEIRFVYVHDVVQHHAEYYGRQWSFDERFTAQVQKEFSEFVDEFNSARDGLWWASDDAGFCGAIAMDGSRSEPGEVRVRWFIVSEQSQGMGVGSKLFEQAMRFYLESEFEIAYLWTFAGLEAARTLYERNGFALTEEAVGDGWGPTITEQKFVLDG